MLVWRRQLQSNRTNESHYFSTIPARNHIEQPVNPSLETVA